MKSHYSYRYVFVFLFATMVCSLEALAQTKFNEVQIVGTNGTITIATPPGLTGDIPLTLPATTGDLISVSGTPDDDDILSYNSGEPVWKTMPAFSVNTDNTQTVSITDVYQNVVFENTDYVYGGGSWTGTTTYTVPETGLYHIDVKAVAQTSAGAPKTARIALFIDGTEYRGTEITLPTNNHTFFLGINLDLELTATQQVQVRLKGSGTNVSIQGADLAWFSGHRVR